MFAYDKSTNRLSLQPGQAPPWIRPERASARTQDANKTWLFCTDCHHSLSSCGGASERRHLPFRDKASQARLKHVDRSGRFCTRNKQPDEEANAERVQDRIEEMGRDAAQRARIRQYRSGILHI